MKSLYKILIIIMSCIWIVNFAQNEKSKKYDTSNRLNKKYGFQRIQLLSKSKNTYDFMALGYYINANNNMYLKTKDSKYLDNNRQIIKPILIDNGSSNFKTHKWLMRVPKSNQNAVVNGQEHLISEGYFFRYVGEFLDIITENRLYLNDQSSLCEGLKYSFTKWQKRSFGKYGDFSMLYHQRLHTGANWALTVLYLKKYDPVNSKMYSSFLNQFDDQLKKALILNKSGNTNYYSWNSTYPEKFCKALQGIKNYKSIIQDVSHGNHIVLYLIKAKELNNENWVNFNFQYLANTLKFKILQEDYIADNVDGTSSKDVKNTGWKISDGWMKLIYFDKRLYPIIEKNLVNYQSQINNSSLSSQFNSIYP